MNPAAVQKRYERRQAQHTVYSGVRRSFCFFVQGATPRRRGTPEEVKGPLPFVLRIWRT